MVGNEKGKPLSKISLRDLLGNLRDHLTKPDSWKGDEKSMLARPTRQRLPRGAEARGRRRADARGRRPGRTQHGPPHPGATSNGVVSEADMTQIAAQIKRVYDEADYVGSLVSEGETGRPTEHHGSKVEPVSPENSIHAGIQGVTSILVSNLICAWDLPSRSLGSQRVPPTPSAASASRRRHRSDGPLSLIHI